MVYDLTEKLKFNAAPQLKIRNETISINSDAETVLKLMSLVQEQGQIEASLEAANLLFNEKDRKIISDMKLSFEDYNTLLDTAMDLAVGNDPDEESEAGE